MFFLRSPSITIWPFFFVFFQIRNCFFSAVFLVYLVQCIVFLLNTPLCRALIRISCVLLPKYWHSIDFPQSLCHFSDHRLCTTVKLPPDLKLVICFYRQSSPNSFSLSSIQSVIFSMTSIWTAYTIFTYSAKSPSLLFLFTSFESARFSPTELSTSLLHSCLIGYTVSFSHKQSNNSPFSRYTKIFQQ